MSDNADTRYLDGVDLNNLCFSQTPNFISCY